MGRCTVYYQQVVALPLKCVSEQCCSSNSRAVQVTFNKSCINIKKYVRKYIDKEPGNSTLRE
eukprot:13264-Heterococcus_DN1.PRE.2